MVSMTSSGQSKVVTLLALYSTQLCKGCHPYPVAVYSILREFKNTSSLHGLIRWYYFVVRRPRGTKHLRTWLTHILRRLGFTNASESSDYRTRFLTLAVVLSGQRSRCWRHFLHCEKWSRKDVCFGIKSRGVPIF